ncbi:hypothetical protein P154DRAFT_581221 [Amniculicola lignicola CBS 123094]|uniref:Uncharacterized protein n=1 Tax=Amniculicola lignicola CBS 123094 TaxID=1392246 RepID=A0A6A5W7J6_9PLEO|nr:hypothetical protein P154DRAFT_581221 [Amniculicola lignicola CBS 123094]
MAAAADRAQQGDQSDRSNDGGNKCIVEVKKQDLYEYLKNGTLHEYLSLHEYLKEVSNNSRMEVSTGATYLSAHRAIFVFLNGIHFPHRMVQYEVFYLDDQLQPATANGSPPRNAVEHGFTDGNRLPAFAAHCLNAAVVGNGSSWALDTIQSAGDTMTTT